MKLHNIIREVINEEFDKEIPKHPESRTATEEAREKHLYPKGDDKWMDRSGKIVAQTVNGQLQSADPSEEANQHPSHLAKNTQDEPGHVGDPYANPKVLPLKEPYQAHHLTDKHTTHHPNDYTKKVPGSIHPPLDKDKRPIEVEVNGKPGLVDYVDEEKGTTHVSFHDGSMNEFPTHMCEPKRNRPMQESILIEGALWDHLNDNVNDPERKRWSPDEWRDHLHETAHEFAKRFGSNEEAHRYLVDRANTLQQQSQPNETYDEWKNRAKELIYMGQLAGFLQPVGKHLNDQEPIEDDHIATHPNDETSGLENLQRMALKAGANYKRAEQRKDDVSQATNHEILQAIRNELGM